jgi:hypothetical protein
MPNKAASIAQVCIGLDRGDANAAVALLQSGCRWGIASAGVSAGGAKSLYPPSVPAPTKRRYGARDSTHLFLRDGFIDRYSGERLVYPGVLRLLSHLYPSEFPYHPNWKFGVGHPWYWDLFPTVDHIVPVTLGGEDAEANWVTTSMRRNLAKSNRSIEAMEWQLLPPGDASKWDGLLAWYVDYLSPRPEMRGLPSLGGWYRAATAILNGR